jgi:hypothetical protein
MFIEHPESVGESYGEHLLVAAGFGVSMVAGGIACLVHALVPGLCVKTGSATITRLHEAMVTHRRARRTAGVTSADALEWVI